MAAKKSSSLGAILLWFLGVVIVVIVVGGAYVYFLPPPEVLGDNLALGQVQKIDVSAPIRISFSRFMDKSSVEKSFHIAPSLKGNLTWDGNTLVFTPEKKEFDANKNYEVWIDEQAQDIFRKKLKSSFYQQFATAGPPKVVMQLPQGVVENMETPITVVFDRAMIPVTTLQASPNLPIPLTVEPEARGNYKWLGTNTVQFIPEKLLPATAYTVKVKKGLTDLYGSALPNDVMWQFDTPHPSVLYTYPPAEYSKAGAKTEVVIRFNQGIDQRSLEQNIEWEKTNEGDAFLDPKLGTGPAEKVAFTLRNEEDGMKTILTPQMPLTNLTSYHVVVKKGLKSAQGTFALDEDYHLTFSTVGDPQVVDSNPKNDEKNAQRYGVTINFSNPMSDENDIDQYIKVEPKVENQFNSLDEYSDGLFLNIGGDFLPSTAYTVTLSKDWADKYGQKMAQDFVLKFETDMTAPDLAFVGRQKFGLIDGYNQNFQQVLQLINVAKVNVTLSKADLNQVFANFGYAAERDFVSVVGEESTWTLDSPNPLNQVVEIPVDITTKVQNSGMYVMTVHDIDNTLREQQQVFIVSKTSLTVKATPQGVLVWATDLKSGLPVSGMKIDVHANANEIIAGGITDNDGLVQLTWPSGFLNEQYNYLDVPPFLVVGTKGDEVAFTGNDFTWNQGIEPWQFNVTESFAVENIRGFLTTERPLYTPGQQVFYKGMFREEKNHQYQLLPTNTQVKVRVMNTNGEEILAKDLITDAHGTISDSLTLADSAPVGMYTLEALIGTQSMVTSFSVQEYKKPTFKVTVKSDKEDYIQGDNATVKVDAAYFFGAPLANAQVTYRVMGDDYFFARYDDYRYNFGDYSLSCFYCDPSGVSGKTWIDQKTITDGQGHLTFNVPTKFTDQKESQLVTVEVGIEDNATKQIIYQRTSFLVHKAGFYLGIANRDYTIKQKDNAVFDIVATDIMANELPYISGEASLYKREYLTVKKKNLDGFFYYDTSFNDTLIRKASFSTTNDGKAQVSFAIPEGGQYHVVVTSTDSKRNQVVAATDIWVSSETYINWGRDNNDRMEIVPDKKEYKLGDTAKLLVKSPYEGVKALVTVERNGIIEKRLTDLATTASIIEIPLKEEYLPNVFVSVVVVKGHGKDGIPGFKLGYINVRIDNVARKLEITATPDKDHYAPKENVHLKLAVKNAEGKPVSGDFAVAVVDESLLALTGENSQDILERFFGQRSLAVRTYTNMTTLIKKIDVKKGGGAKGGGGEDRLQKRANFKDTAHFEPHVLTDAEGKAELQFALPDNITTWQIWVFGATDDTYVGSEKIHVVSRKDVFLEPILPRFVVTGDALQMGAQLHNLTDSAVSGTIKLKVEGAVSTGAEQSVSIPAKGNIIAKWDATIVDNAQLKVTYTFSADKYRDVVEKTVPIYPWVTKQTVAFGNIVDKQALEEIVVPVGTLTDSGELRLRFSRTLLDLGKNTFTDLDNLYYPSGEELTTKLIAKLLRMDISHSFADFNDLVSDQDILSKEINKLFQDLANLQRGDGGIAYWSGSRESDPYLSAYVLHAFQMARKQGFTVPEYALDQLVTYVTDYYSNYPITLTDEEKNLAEKGRETAQARIHMILNTKAYIAHVLTGMGQKNLPLQVLFDRRSELALYGKAYLAMSAQSGGHGGMVDTLYQEIMNKLLKTATSAHFEEEQRNDYLFTNNVTSNAIILQMMARSDSNNPAITDIVRYLLRGSFSQNYRSAQENIQWLIALTELMKVKEDAKASFDWLLTLNEQKVMSGTLAVGAERDASYTLPLSQLKTAGDINGMVIQKTGLGSLYYEGTMSYSVRGTEAEPVTQGLGIYKEYFDFGDKESRNPLQSAKVGQDLRVKLTIIVPEDRYFVHVEDFLPAGLEAQNFDFATTSQIQRDLLAEMDRQGLESENIPYYFYDYWYWNHQEIRDDRVAVFSDFLPKGIYEFSYVARASTPGTFKVRPAQVVQKYFPDVFGSTAATQLTINSKPN